MQLPPPVHGASMVNKTIEESALIKSVFSPFFLDISVAREISDVGKFDLRKSLFVFVIFFRTIFSIIKIRPDQVYLTLSPHGIALYKDGILAILVKLLGCKLIFHLHGKGINNEVKDSAFKQFFYRAIFNNVNVIHLSERLHNDVESVRDKSKNIYSVANGIKPLVIDHAPERGGVINFIYLSNLIRSKGADVLVNAAVILSKKYSSKFNIKIIGKARDKEYLEELEKIIEDHSLSNISILGPLYGQDKVRELSKSHVFVLPTRYKNECFPISILEAMSAGLSVISTDEGAISDIIFDGVNGSIIKELSPESLAAAMEACILDPLSVEEKATENIQKFNRLYTNVAFEEALCRVLQKTI